MVITRRFFSFGKFLLLVGALLGTYGIFAIIGMRVALRAREVEVPELTGQTVSQATASLADLGLSIRIDEQRRIHPTLAVGEVAEQDPASGLTTRQQRSVRVWLSSGSHASAVPTLLGESQLGAQQRLAQDSLSLGEVSEIRSGFYPTDAIVGQEPPPQATGTAVSVLINRGERGETYVMPDLIGSDGTSTAEILREQGFRVTIVGDHPYPGIPQGIVLRQAPLGGFQIAPGESISLEVSQ